MKKGASILKRPFFVAACAGKGCLIRPEWGNAPPIHKKRPRWRGLYICRETVPDYTSGVPVIHSG